MKQTKNILLIFSVLFLQVAQAAITIHYREIGDHVKITFDGDLRVIANPTDALVFNDIVGISATHTILVNDTRTSIRFENVGISHDLGISWGENATPTSLEGVFGFTRDSIVFDSVYKYWAARNESTLIANAESDYFWIYYESLESIHADELAQNTVLWTANGTGDIIKFTSSVAPEPSSSLLLSFGLMGLLLRRSR